MPRAFDEAYYRRHYEEPSTRVVTAESIGRLADFVCAYTRYLGVDVERVLDLGCGVGHWKPHIARHFPEAEYVGVEYSAYLCARFGWVQGSAATYADEPFDLVICQGVLQYLTKRDAERALRNLGRLTAGVLYLEALTRRDWDEKVSQEVTDGDVFLRDVAFYHERLDRRFVRCGGGLFAARDAELVLFDLEHLDPLLEQE